MARRNDPHKYFHTPPNPSRLARKAPFLPTLVSPPNPGLGNPLSSLANDSAVAADGFFGKRSPRGEGAGRFVSSPPTGDASEGDRVEDATKERDRLDLDFPGDDDFFFCFVEGAVPSKSAEPSASSSRDWVPIVSGLSNGGGTNGWSSLEGEGPPLPWQPSNSSSSSSPSPPTANYAAGLFISFFSLRILLLSSFALLASSACTSASRARSSSRAGVS